MNMTVRFSESKQSLNPQFGEVNNISDGGFERGYAAGYEEGVETAKLELDKAQAEVVGLIAHKIVGKFANEDVVTVGGYAFADMSSLTSVDLPNATTIGSYAFQSCTSLEELRIPKVKTISTRCFVNTTRLLRLDLPVCENIGGYCFHGSAKIETLILRSNKVCTLGTDAFGTGPIKVGKGYIYVPDNLVEQYKAAANWSTYAAQIKPISELEGET